MCARYGREAEAATRGVPVKAEAEEEAATGGDDVNARPRRKLVKCCPAHARQAVKSSTELLTVLVLRRGKGRGLVSAVCDASRSYGARQPHNTHLNTKAA